MIFRKKSRRLPPWRSQRKRRVSHGEAAPGVRQGPLRQLGARMADLSLINMDNIPKDKVGWDRQCKVYDNTKNEEVEYKLVTSEESDVAAGKISTSSPIGRALLNKKVGDTASFVTPNGKREMEILTLSTDSRLRARRPSEQRPGQRVWPRLRRTAGCHRALAGLGAGSIPTCSRFLGW